MPDSVSRVTLGNTYDKPPLMAYRKTQVYKYCIPPLSHPSIILLLTLGIMGCLVGMVYLLIHRPDNGLLIPLISNPVWFVGIGGLLFMGGVGIWKMVIHRHDCQMICEAGLIEIRGKQFKTIPYDTLEEIWKTNPDSIYYLCPKSRRRRLKNLIFSVTRPLSYLLLSWVDSLKQRPYTESFYDYTFKSCTGVVITSNVQDIADRMTLELSNRLTAELFQSYAMGKQIQFGSLTISRQGLIGAL